MGAGRLLVSCAVLAAVAFAQEADRPDWVKDNYVGWPSPELMRSPGGTLRWVGLWGSRRFRHGGSVRAAVVSPDSTWIASASCVGGVVWDSGSGKQIRVFGPRREFESLVCSRDGQHLIAGDGGGDITIYDAASGVQLRSWRADVGGGVPGLALSPDGKWLASCGPYAMRVWEARTGDTVCVLELGEEVHQVAFSVDGEYLFAAYQDRMRAWRTHSWRPVRAFRNPVRERVAGPDELLGLAVARDEVAIAQTTGIVRRWSLTTGLRRANALEDAFTTALSYSPDGDTLIMATLAGELALLRRSTHTTTRHADIAALWVNTIAFDPSGSWFVTGDNDGALRAWDMAMESRLAAPQGEVLALTLCQAGTYAIVGRASTASLIRVATGEVLREFPFDGDPEPAIAVAGQAPWVLLGEPDGSISVLHGPSGRLLHRMVGHEDSVIQIVPTPDGRLAASTSHDGTVRLWDLDNGRPIRALELWTVAAAAPSPDGHLLASGDMDGAVQLWDAGTGALKRTLTAHGKSSTVGAVLFSPDGKSVASASDDGSVHITDIAGARPVCSIAPGVDGATGIAWSPDGRRLYSTGWDGMLRIWDPSTGSQIDSIPVDGSPTSLALHGDHVYVGCRNSTVCVYKYTPPQNGRRDSESDK